MVARWLKMATKWFYQSFDGKDSAESLFTSQLLSWGEDATLNEHGPVCVKLGNGVRLDGSRCPFSSRQQRDTGRRRHRIT